MIITPEQLRLIEFTTTVYDGYINFGEYELKMVDCYTQEMFKKSYIKHNKQVLVFIPSSIAEGCTEVFIDNENIIKFFGNDNNLLLTTYSQCLEDVVGMSNIKAFVFI